MAAAGLRLQFRRCKEAAQELQRQRAMATRIPNQVELTGLVAAGGLAGSVLAFMDDKNRERLQEFGGVLAEEAAHEAADQATDQICSGNDDSKAGECDAGDGDIDCGDCSN